MAVSQIGLWGHSFDKATLQPVDVTEDYRELDGELSHVTRGVRVKKSWKWLLLEHAGQIPAVPEHAGNMPKPWNLTTGAEWSLEDL